MNRVYEEFRGRGFTLALVNIGEQREHVRQVVAERGYTAPVLLDEHRRVSDSYAVVATPTVYLLDRDLRVVARGVGRRDWTGDPARNLLESLLALPHTEGGSSR